MKRRIRLEQKRAKRREQRRKMNFKSLGKSAYATKAKSGNQMYGPAPNKEQVNRLVSRDARVREEPT